MTEPSTLTFSVLRSDPDRGQEPEWVKYTVQRRPRMRILDALVALEEELGEAVAVEWYCGVKKCGACSVTVDGRPVMACWEEATEGMKVAPLAGFPVIRDLVTDRSQEQRERERVVAPLQRSAPYGGFPETVGGQAFRAAELMSQCVECSICTSACPTVGEQFSGPAVLVQLARVGLDPRDGGGRGSAAVREAGISGCISCHACTDVCPAGIPVLEVAIESLRAIAVRESEDAIFPSSIGEIITALR